MIPKIALISTVINKELYVKSSKLFPSNIQKYVIDGTNGMHGINSIFYMMKMLKGAGIEWIVMSDEDVLFKKSDLVFEIIKKMESENYSVCGVRDGGVISHRGNNPYVINTFFSVINFREIESIWDKNEVLKNNYTIDNEFDDDVISLKEAFDVKSTYEPYYGFYLWLRRNKKQFLFLDADQPFSDDKISNAVYFKGEVLLYHTWYARSYGINQKHTDRINAIFEKITSINKETLKPIVFRDKTFFVKQKIIKFFIKLQIKINS